jgi:hypothetical protein
MNWQRRYISRQLQRHECSWATVTGLLAATHIAPLAPIPAGNLYSLQIGYGLDQVPQASFTVTDLAASRLARKKSCQGWRVLALFDEFLVVVGSAAA